MREIRNVRAVRLHHTVRIRSLGNERKKDECMMISVILFLSFFYFDKNGEKIGDVDIVQIENYIEDNSLECMVANLFDFNG